MLDTYVGDYPRGKNDIVRVSRLPDGLLQMTFSDFTVVMHAESMTKFYALTTDVQCEFKFDGGAKELDMSVGDNGVMKIPRRRNRLQGVVAN